MPKPLLLTTFFAALIGLVGVNADAAVFYVNSTTDAVDANPGDGVCATAAGQCTLRAAIQETNALPGADRIILPAGVYTITIPGRNEDAAATGDLDITDNLTVTGAGAETTIVDGGGLDRVFQIPAVADVWIQQVTVRNGDVTPTSDSGGGIFNGIANLPGGHLRLSAITVSGNAAVFGGGIMNGWGASATLEGVTISGNSAAYGAGLYTRDSGGVKILNSTLSGNIASTGGGGIDTFANATLALSYVTVTQNSALIGSGINHEAGTKAVILSSTIVADNLSSGNCAGFPISKGYNLDSDNTCHLSQPTDLPGQNPLLGPLQDNGGPTYTHALLAGSPAIDAANPAVCPPVDQRHHPRPIDGNGNGIAICDIGAYEYSPPV